jgi:hypothetical protein
VVPVLAMRPIRLVERTVTLLGITASDRSIHATHKQQNQQRALECAAWLSGGNPAGASVYMPRSGCCFDGISEDGRSHNCGAESAIEAGLVEMARRRLERNRYGA